MADFPARAASRTPRHSWRVRLDGLLLRLVVLAVVAVVGFATWVVLFSTWLGVRDVRVVGTDHLDPARVEQAAAIAPGTPLARLDVAAIERRVEVVPGVAVATVSRAWPNGVRIQVVESRPVAAVRQGGHLVAMDAGGVLFRRLHKPDRLPLVRTDSLAADTRTAALAQVAEVVTSLAPDIARRVDHVEVSSVDSIMLALRNGDQVRWGSAAASDQKAAVLAALLDIKARVYDVSVPGQPATSS